MANQSYSANTYRPNAQSTNIKPKNTSSGWTSSQQATYDSLSAQRDANIAKSKTSSSSGSSKLTIINGQATELQQPQSVDPVAVANQQVIQEAKSTITSQPISFTNQYYPVGSGSIIANQRYGEDQMIYTTGEIKAGNEQRNLEQTKLNQQRDIFQQQVNNGMITSEYANQKLSQQSNDANIRINQASQKGGDLALSGAYNQRILNMPKQKEITFSNNGFKNLFADRVTASAYQGNVSKYLQAKADSFNTSSTNDIFGLNYNELPKIDKNIDYGHVPMSLDINGFSNQINAQGYRFADIGFNTGFNVMRPDISLRQNPTTLIVSMIYGTTKILPETRFLSVATPIVDKILLGGVALDIGLRKPENRWKEVTNIAGQTPIFVAGAMAPSLVKGFGTGAVGIGKQVVADFKNPDVWSFTKGTSKQSFTIGSVSSSTIRPEMNFMGEYGGRILFKTEINQLRINDVSQNTKSYKNTFSNKDPFGLNKKATLAIGRSGDNNFQGTFGQGDIKPSQPEIIGKIDLTSKYKEPIDTKITYEVRSRSKISEEIRPKVDIFGKTKIGSTFVSGSKYLSNGKSIVSPFTITNSKSISLMNTKPLISGSTGISNVGTISGSTGISNVGTISGSTGISNVGNISISQSKIESPFDFGSMSTPKVIGDTYIPLFSFDKGGGGGDFNFFTIRKKKRKYKYNPTVFSIITGRKSKKIQNDISGFSIRPVRI